MDLFDQTSHVRKRTSIFPRWEAIGSDDFVQFYGRSPLVQLSTVKIIRRTLMSFSHCFGMQSYDLEEGLQDGIGGVCTCTDEHC